MKINRKKKPKKKIIIPDSPIMRLYQKGNKPKIPGKYLTFYDPNTISGWSNTRLSAYETLIYFDGKKWYGNTSFIIGYIGPIHEVLLEDLKKGKINQQIFYVSTPKKIKKKIYEEGPFITYFSAACRLPKIGQRIYCVDRKGVHVISKAIKRPNGEIKWDKK